MDLIILFVGIIVLLLLLLLTFCALLVHCGLLYDVKVGTGKPPIGQFTGAYKFGRGPYKDVGDVFTETTSLNPILKCFGAYYDNPKEVPAEKLRYAIGSILAEDDREPDEDMVKLYTKNGFKLFRFPAISHSVGTNFPFQSRISIFLAKLRVYPAVSAYVENKKLCAHPCLEIYQDDKMFIMMPLAKQTEFYVPEAEEARRKDEEEKKKAEEEEEETEKMENDEQVINE